MWGCVCWKSIHGSAIPLPFLSTVADSGPGGWHLCSYTCVSCVLEALYVCVFLCVSLESSHSSTAVPPQH